MRKRLDDRAQGVRRKKPEILLKFSLVILLFFPMLLCVSAALGTVWPVSASTVVEEKGIGEIPTLVLTRNPTIDPTQQPTPTLHPGLLLAEKRPNALPQFDIIYWNGTNKRFYIPEEVWASTVNAADKHGCNPHLLIAIAHSESSVYNNTVCSLAGACGVWQFMPGTFDYYNQIPGANRFNIQASAEAACLMTMNLGLDKEANQNDFVENFAGLDGSQVWNGHVPQAKYVWQLWKKLEQIS